MKNFLIAVLMLAFLPIVSVLYGRPATAAIYDDTRVAQSAVILFSAATTGEIDLTGTTLVGIVWPAAMTNTAAYFMMASASGGTYVPITYSSGTSINIPVLASGTYTAIDPTLFNGIHFLKVTTAANEGANRTLTIISKSNP